ncbi:uncharacterized protein LOC125501739 [Athalia rosae]|uniref:uncharacterized protein LOC125501739 n=1 Tax=Athalia rosae TaxID=37344 RepID=UPI0020349FE5|nr:uncharacterized protein LOC125501739 [Athalia rosae]
MTSHRLWITRHLREGQEMRKSHSWCQNRRQSEDQRRQCSGNRILGVKIEDSQRIRGDSVQVIAFLVSKWKTVRGSEAEVFRHLLVLELDNGTKQHRSYMSVLFEYRCSVSMKNAEESVYRISQVIDDTVC